MTTTIQIEPLEQIPTLPREPHPHRQRLLRAADLIEERGWCREQFKNGAGQLCIRGAWYEAADELEFDGEVWLPLRHYEPYANRLEAEAFPRHAANWNNRLADDGGVHVVRVLRLLAAGYTWQEATAHTGFPDSR